MATGDYEMKNINVGFDSTEIKELEQIKEDSGLKSWKELIIKSFRFYADEGYPK